MREDGIERGVTAGAERAADFWREYDPDMRQKLETKVAEMHAGRPDPSAWSGQAHYTFDNAGRRLSKKTQAYKPEYITESGRQLEASRTRHAAELVAKSPKARRDLIDAKKMSEIMEAMLIDKGEGIFHGARIYPVSEYTDLCQGIDAMLVVEKEDGSIAQMIGLDFTYAEEEREWDKKIAKSVKGVMKGTLANPQYLQIGDRKVDASAVPKVTIPLAGETVRDWAKLWAQKMPFAIANAPQRKDMLLLVQSQLALQSAVAQGMDTQYFESPGKQRARQEAGKKEMSDQERNRRKMRVADSLVAANTYIAELLASDELREKDPVSDAVTRGMRALLTNPVSKERIMQIAKEELDAQWQEERDAIATPATSPAPDAAHIPEHVPPADVHAEAHDEHAAEMHETHRAAEAHGPEHTEERIAHVASIHAPTTKIEKPSAPAHDGGHGTPSRWWHTPVAAGAGFIANLLEMAWQGRLVLPNRIGFLTSGDEKNPWSTLWKNIAAAFKPKKGGGGGHAAPSHSSSHGHH